MNENTSVGIAEQLSVSSPKATQVDTNHFLVVTESKFSNVYVVSAPDAKTAVEWVLDSDNTPDFIQNHLGERAVRVEPTDFTDPMQARIKFPNHN
jgi:hypothetical protein